MIRFAALLVAASVLVLNGPSWADGVPPVVLAPAYPPPAEPVYIPVYIWVPGHWIRNPPMNTHVWVPGMYIRPPSPEEQQRLASRPIGQWFGIGGDN